MSTSCVCLRRPLGVVLGILAVPLAFGQPLALAQAPAAKAPPAAVHRMVILQGPNRSVHYIASGNLVTRDSLALAELQRAENELAYVQDLQQLKQQYINSERIMEPQRRYVQEQLYGTQISYSGFSSAFGSGGYGGRRYAYPYAYGSYGYGGLGSGFGGMIGSSYNVIRSLQFGMGDEGRMKDALVQQIAHESSGEYAAAALRNYENAAAHAAASPFLSRELSLTPAPAPAPEPAPAPRAAEPTFKKGSKVTIWVGNDKYAGTVRDDRPGWVVLQTDKAEVTVRKSQITRSEAPK
jgi:hypothetical protein